MNIKQSLYMELIGVGMMHVDGRNPETGQHFSRNLTLYHILLKSPGHEDIHFTDVMEMDKCFDAAIERCENMLEGMRQLKAKHFP